jgi:hypothetical protein
MTTEDTRAFPFVILSSFVMKQLDPFGSSGALRHPHRAALKEFEHTYVTYEKRTITKPQLLKALGTAQLWGVFSGCYRSVLSVVWQISRSICGRRSTFSS